MDGDRENHRLPPQNLEAEQSVLGAVLLENKALAEVLTIITADDFYRDSHRKIFTAMVEMDVESANIDLVTLTDALRKRNQLDSAGGPSYLVQIMDVTPTAENVSYYAGIVKEKAMLRRILNLGTELVTSAYRDSVMAEEILAELEIARQELVEKLATGKRIKRMKVADFHGLAGLRETPYKHLNDAIGGFLPKELICVGGNKGMGKTSFVSGLLAHTAIAEKLPAVYCGSAMWEERFRFRILSGQSGVPFDALIRGKVCAENKTKLLATQKAMDNAEIYYLIEPKELNVVTLSAELKRLKREVNELGVVVIENFQELRFPGKFKDPFEEQRRVATLLTGMADELNAPVVISCQIGKETDRRENRRPMLNDLKDAGAIGEKAIKVFLLYRPKYYELDVSGNGEKSVKGPEIGEVIIAKGGPPMIIPTIFDGNTYSWRDVND